MTTLLVDGPNIYRRAASVSGDDPGKALHIFIKSLARYTRDVNPDHMLVCWDLDGSQVRRAIYPDYKANRPTGQGASWSEATSFLAAAGIEQVMVQGFEADDLIGAVVIRHRWLAPFVILSGDRDLLQLVGDEVTQIRPGTNVPDERWGPAEVEAEFGCHPSHYAIVKAVMGDKGDNIDGVPRVGIKTAVKDLKAQGWSLDHLLASDKYREHRQVIQRNLALVDLSHHSAVLGIPPPGPFSPTRRGSVEWPVLAEFCEQHDLNDVASLLGQDALWPPPT